MKKFKIVSLPILCVTFACLCVVLLLSFFETEISFFDDNYFIILAIILMSALILSIVFALIAIDRKKENVHYDNIRATIENEISNMQKNYR